MAQSLTFIAVSRQLLATEPVSQAETGARQKFTPLFWQLTGIRKVRISPHGFLFCREWLAQQLAFKASD
jgi:hypothetical protein